MKKLISLLTALALGLLMCIPAVAADSTGAAPFSVAEWQGNSSISDGNCCFVTRNTSITTDVTVPEDSMLVVTDGAALKISGKLTVKGTLAVHDDAKINVRKGGTLLLGRNSITVANGEIAISRGGKLRNYGYLQSSGRTAVKGTLKNYSRGTFAYSAAPLAYSGGRISGGRTRISGAPLYYVQELESLAGNDMKLFDEHTGETAYTNFNELPLIRSAEAVLYKYERTIHSAEYPEPDSELRDLMDGRYITAEPVSVYPEPLAFGVHEAGLLVLTTTSAKDGSTTGDIYATCRGAQNEALFLAYFGEDSPKWSSSLTDRLSDTFKSADSVVFAECTGRSGEGFTFRTLEVMKGDEPAEYADGQFLLAPTDDGRYFSFAEGNAYVLPLCTEFADTTMHGDFILLMKNIDGSYYGNTYYVQGIPYSPDGSVVTLGKLNELM